jgi:chorismate synthase
MNTFGQIFRLTSFGESHGKAIGGVIDGCPSGVEIDMEFIQRELDRRKPGQSDLSTPRKEDDGVEFLSGVYDGKTTGTPIGFVIWNKNQKSKHYNKLSELYRPSHADYTYDKKYANVDFRGGGRSSARETASRVVAGAVAKLVLKQLGIEVLAYVNQVGDVKLEKPYTDLDLSLIESNNVRCPDTKIADEMEKKILKAKQVGDSLGGKIIGVVKGCPVGVGEPVFAKLNAKLGEALMSINAVKAFEIGEGFTSIDKYASEYNDAFYLKDGEIRTKTNNVGGILGGISNGEDIWFGVGFKPVPTIFKTQHTVTKSGQEVEFRAEGRHDPCVLPRAVPIVESMTAITLLDLIMLDKSKRILD